VLLHLSGVHGVEGFLGSAIQCHLLANPPSLPDHQALIFVHAVNPWGMAWLRRFNENNVDLNRNFLANGENYEGAPPGYAKLDPLLNPKHLPGSLDLFLVRCVFAIAQYGFAKLKETVASGQYEYSQGLFFGGTQLEESARLLSAWIREHLTSGEKVVAIDIHSGLGKFGEAVLFYSGNRSSTEYSMLKESYGDSIQPLSKEGVAYTIRGMFMEGLATVLPDADWLCIGQEFGTYAPLRVLKALRDENCWHHYCKDLTIEHPVKKTLLRTFCPESDVWQRAVISRGEQLVHDALDMMKQNS